jgi:hypothetical protein
MWIPQALGTANFIERVTGVNYSALDPARLEQAANVER